MPPRRAKRKIEKATMTSSTSGSDSDDTVTSSLARRKRARVVSEDSGESDVTPDSDADSNVTEWAKSDAAESLPPTPKPAYSKCSICLLPFTDQLVGTPQCCDHTFCLDCITEWAKRANTCPVDREHINFIDVKERVGGRVIRKELVKGKRRRQQ